VARVSSLVRGKADLPDLKLVKLSDTRLLELARSEAQKIFEEDERLEKPENRLLAKQVADFWRQTTDLS
jgi:ATP-dependent DNA helicase RecG